MDKSLNATLNEAKRKLLYYLGLAIGISHVILWAWIAYAFVIWLNAANPYALAQWIPLLFFAWIAAFITSYWLLGCFIDWLIAKVRSVFA